jgi:hypothetical protein
MLFERFALECTDESTKIEPNEVDFLVAKNTIFSVIRALLRRDFLTELAI